MKKMLIIGVDGMDYGLTRQWLDELPRLKQMNDEGYFGSCLSVFPPDSIPAWVSIYTGLDPSCHGILDSINYLDQKKIRKDSIDTSAYKQNTFWDALSRAGKKVCVINPFLVYPSWPVNGMMLTGPVFEGGDISTWPESLKDERPMPYMGGFVDFPDVSELPAFLEKTLRVTREQVDLGLDLYRENEFDCFFLSLQTLDRIKHFFWRFVDPQDPTYPGKNPYENVVRDYYKLIDDAVGRFMEVAGPDTLIVVNSDHGHQRRCTRLFYLNEYLRREGFLATHTPKKGISLNLVIEKAKITTLNILDALDMQDLAFRIGKLIPSKKRKALKKSSFIINKPESLAWASEFCSANPHGGIEINVEKIPEGQTYESVCQRLIDGLEQLIDPENGTRLFQQVFHRDKLFQGPYKNIYPDILFELDEAYGVNWSVFTPLTGKNPTHKKISGGHRNEGVCLLSQPSACPPRQLTEYYNFFMSYFELPLLAVTDLQEKSLIE